MAHTPLNLTPAQVQEEVLHAWANAYSPEATGRAIDSIADEPAPYKISHLMARLFFRGIYFPQKGTWNWVKLIAQNRRTIFRIVRDCFTNWGGSAGRRLRFNSAPAPAQAEVPSEQP
jgi:hypothetical protein